MNNKKILGKSALVIGATGVVGSKLVDQLLRDESYATVWVLVRTTTAKVHDKLQEIILDFNELEDYYPKMYIDDVYCAIGTTIKQAKTKEAMYQIDVEYPLTVVRLAKQHGVHHVVVVSAVGANSKSPIFYSRMKGELEEQLIELDLPNLSIVRPPLLLDIRKESRIGESLSSIFSRKVQGVVSATIRPNLGIYAMIVAKAMHNATMGTRKKINIYNAIAIEKLAKQ